VILLQGRSSSVGQRDRWRRERAGFKIASNGQTITMDHMPSPARAERNQQRKLRYLPPIWPLIAGLVVIAIITILASH
jgi:hypothetical protein